MIDGFGIENHALALQLCDQPVEIFAFEIDLRPARRAFGVRRQMERERRLAVRQFETRIMFVLDDQPKAERLVESDGAFEIERRDRDLVETHQRFSSITSKVDSCVGYGSSSRARPS